MHKQDGFADFVREVEPRLRRALIAAAGPEIGREATADAFGYAWQHWERVQGMGNPAGYLYRVGCSAAKRYRRPAIAFPQEVHNPEPMIEPGLEKALFRLSERQRTSVLLVEGYQMTYREVADLLGLSRSTVQQHVTRGLDKLRRALEVTRVP